MQQKLTRLGYEIVAHHDSVEALKAFQAAPQHFDLIITDQTMPHLTGTDLAREVALLHEILDRAGFEVVEAANGVEGLSAYRAEPTDLVITDLIMPEKEGVETILELRGEFPSARIVAISGGGRNGARDYLAIATRLGARRVVAKPFSRQEILDAVHAALMP